MQNLLYDDMMTDYNEPSIFFFWTNWSIVIELSCYRLICTTKK